VAYKTALYHYSEHIWYKFIICIYIFRITVHLFELRLSPKQYFRKVSVIYLVRYLFMVHFVRYVP
jgi:hypothetical protein